MKVLGAWLFGVFDGHGGWQAAEFAQKNIQTNLEVELANRLGIGHEVNRKQFVLDKKSHCNEKKKENNMLGAPQNTEVDGIVGNQESIYEGGR